jgi:hypothetical protein
MYRLGVLIGQAPPVLEPELSAPQPLPTLPTRAVVGVQAVEGVHEPGLTGLVARVEEVPPVIRCGREIHQHHAACLIVKAGPVQAFEDLHGGANEVRRKIGGIGQPHGGTLAIQRPHRGKPIGHHKDHQVHGHQALAAELLSRPADELQEGFLDRLQLRQRPAKRTGHRQAFPRRGDQLQG